MPESAGVVGAVVAVVEVNVVGGDVHAAVAGADKHCNVIDPTDSHPGFGGLRVVPSASPDQQCCNSERVVAEDHNLRNTES